MTRLCCVLAIALFAGNVQASLITYRWQGSLEPDTGDPWGIGPIASFSAVVTLEDVTDTDSRVDTAEFPVTELALTVGGVDAIIVDPGTMFFADRASNDLGRLTGAQVQVSGVVSEFASGFFLTGVEFAFTEPFEFPPVWDEAFGFGTSDSGSYDSTVSENAPITARVVPEPSTLAIWSLLGLAGLGYGWRKKRKAA